MLGALELFFSTGRGLFVCIALVLALLFQVNLASIASLNTIALPVLFRMCKPRHEW